MNESQADLFRRDHITRGFAGLVSLVSDVTSDISEAQRLGRSGRTASVPTSPSPSPTPVVRAPLGRMTPGAKLAWGLVAIITIVGIIQALSNTSNTPPAEVQPAPSASVSTVPNPAQPAPKTGGPYDNTLPLPDTSTLPSPSMPTPPPKVIAPPAAPDLYGEKPPVGTDLVLNASQIRYCLAEGIRIDAIKALLDSQRGSAQDVDRFNRHVDLLNSRVNDYNSRCASFRYYRDTFDQVRKDIEAHRAIIEKLAREQVESQ